jgi:hypothetical protein
VIIAPRGILAAPDDGGAAHQAIVARRFTAASGEV